MSFPKIIEQHANVFTPTASEATSNMLRGSFGSSAISIVLENKTTINDNKSSVHLEQDQVNHSTCSKLCSRKVELYLAAIYTMIGLAQLGNAAFDAQFHNKTHSSSNDSFMPGSDPFELHDDHHEIPHDNHVHVIDDDHNELHDDHETDDDHHKTHDPHHHVHHGMFDTATASVIRRLGHSIEGVCSLGAAGVTFLGIILGKPGETSNFKRCANTMAGLSTLGTSLAVAADFGHDHPYHGWLHSAQVVTGLLGSLPNVIWKSNNKSDRAPCDIHDIARQEKQKLIRKSLVPLGNLAEVIPCTLLAIDLTSPFYIGESAGNVVLACINFKLLRDYINRQKVIEKNTGNNKSETTIADHFHEPTSLAIVLETKTSEPVIKAIPFQKRASQVSLYDNLSLNLDSTQEAVALIEAGDSKPTTITYAKGSENDEPSLICERILESTSQSPAEPLQHTPINRS